MQALSPAWKKQPFTAVRRTASLASRRVSADSAKPLLVHLGRARQTSLAIPPDIPAVCHGKRDQRTTFLVRVRDVLIKLLASAPKSVAPVICLQC